MAVLLEEEETERNRIQRRNNGFVAIVYHIGPLSLNEIDRKLYWQGLCSLKQLPLRIISGGIHYCFDDYTIRQATSLFIYRLREEDRARYHLHDGESSLYSMHACMHASF
jgi:hypothetical protein